MSILYARPAPAFPFLYWFAARCRGESEMPALPAGGVGSEGKQSGQLRTALMLWWGVPILFISLIVIGRVIHNVPFEFVDAVDDGRSAAILHAMDQGQSVDTSTVGGQTALHSAAKSGDAELMEALLDRGAQLDKADSDGWTPLMSAVHNHHDAAAELLVARGANVNLRNDDGRTALIIAAMNGSSSIVSLLVTHGADVSIRDEHGKSAADYARDEGNTEILRALRQ